MAIFFSQKRTTYRLASLPNLALAGRSAFVKIFTSLLLFFHIPIIFWQKRCKTTIFFAKTAIFLTKILTKLIKLCYNIKKNTQKFSQIPSKSKPNDAKFDFLLKKCYNIMGYIIYTDRHKKLFCQSAATFQ